MSTKELFWLIVAASLSVEAVKLACRVAMYHVSLRFNRKLDSYGRPTGLLVDGL